MRRDSELKLFQARDKSWVTYGQLVQAMRDVKADDCDVLLVHTDLSFGLLNREIKRKELVEILFDSFVSWKLVHLYFQLLLLVMGTEKIMM